MLGRSLILYIFSFFSSCNCSSQCFGPNPSPDASRRPSLCRHKVRSHQHASIFRSNADPRREAPYCFRVRWWRRCPVSLMDQTSLCYVKKIQRQEKLVYYHWKKNHFPKYNCSNKEKGEEGPKTIAAQKKVYVKAKYPQHRKSFLPLLRASKTFLIFSVGSILLQRWWKNKREDTHSSFGTETLTHTHNRPHTQAHDGYSNIIFFV